MSRLLLFLLAALFSGDIYYQMTTPKYAMTIQGFSCNITLTRTTKLVIEKGDITKSPVDVIVNAANEGLFGGAGVCGAIFTAAGWQDLQDACDLIPEVEGIRCPAGQAVITDSFALRRFGVRHIIHAVGPHCFMVTDEQEQDRLLAGAYTKSLQLADQADLHAIAFPFISTGIYGFPKDRAAEIALKSLVSYAEHVATKITTIRMVLFSQDDYELVCEVAKKILR